MNNSTEIDFLISSLYNSKFNQIPSILNWLKQKNERVSCIIEQTPLSKLKQWSISGYPKSLMHKSGMFFAIEGINVSTNWGMKEEWEQPIINQPEVGFLGIIAKKIDGVLHFLMQAKIEPGNLNKVQLSPTLQATRSNYTRVHKGNSPKYLEYFTSSNRNITILVDQLQSEQGARFRQKRNRNIIIEIPIDTSIEINDDFIWLTLLDIKELIQYHNVVNMDARSVISSISYGNYNTESVKVIQSLINSIHQSEFKNNGSVFLSLLNSEQGVKSLGDIIKWITKLKFKTDLNIRKIDVLEIDGWYYDKNEIIRNDNKYFKVIGVNVAIGDREVVSWDQPMIKPMQEGLIGLVCKEINGVIHFLIQAKMESGNFDLLEFAPTVQCLTGNYRTGVNEYSVPFIEVIVNAPNNRILYSAFQSEEGGRFFEEQNLNRIVKVVDELDEYTIPDNYCWMTLNQILSFGRYNNYLNIALRSLISAVSLNIFKKE